jgi:hypothetical protein
MLIRQFFCQSHPKIAREYNYTRAYAESLEAITFALFIQARKLLRDLQQRVGLGKIPDFL